MEFLAYLGLLRGNVLCVPSSHVVLDRCLLYVGQINLQDLFRDPASVIQIQEAHLVDARVSQEDLQRAQVSVNQLLLVEHRGKVNDFKD